MLALRLQRRGRKKLAMYRLIAQEHSLQPTSGKVVAYLGNYNPHSKEFNVDKDEVEKYLGNGAQPSNRVAILLKNAGVKLPKWVVIKEKTAKAVEPEATDDAEAPAETEKPAEPEAEPEAADDTAEEPAAKEETEK